MQVSTIYEIGIHTQIYKGDSRPDMLPRIMALLAMGLKLGIFGFLPTTNTPTNASMTFSYHAVFQRVYFHTQTAVDTGDIHT